MLLRELQRLHKAMWPSTNYVFPRKGKVTEFAGCYKLVSPQRTDYFDMETLELVVLPDMREFFKTHAWTQEVVARLPDGSGTWSDNPEACSWCLAGGINRACGQGAARRVLHKLLKDATGGGVISWNDAPGRTLEQVLELLEKVYDSR